MNWQSRDKRSVWHPYTQHKQDIEPAVIVGASGTYLQLEDGSKLLDAISSWWVNLYGHSHPYITQKIQDQLHAYQQVMFADFTHPLAIELAENILQLFDGVYQKVFFSDNGSTSVEVALKMCFQYWHNQSIPKTKMIAFSGSYHGDTFGAMSVGSRGTFTNPYMPYLFDVIFIDPPIRNQQNNQTLQQLSDVITKHPNQIAGLIYEPIVQGAGGMVMHDIDQLDIALSLCKRHNILLIADEVMTGFGRTGKNFASFHLTNQPDMICLSKGLTGGFLPLALTLTKQHIYEAFLADSRNKMFFHGHSFTANAISCAAALASIDLLQLQTTHENINRIEKEHAKFTSQLKELNQSPIEVRQQGTILAVEIQTSEKTSYSNSIREQIITYFYKKNILLRPLGNVLYILPPYCTTNEELETIYKEVYTFIERLARNA